MSERISLKDIEVFGEYKRLKAKNLRPFDSKFQAALNHQTPPAMNEDYKTKPIIDGIQKYLKEMQAALEEMFKTGGRK